MVGKIFGALAALSVAFFSFTCPASAQDTVRIRGTAWLVTGAVIR